MEQLIYTLFGLYDLLPSFIKDMVDPIINNYAGLIEKIGPVFIILTGCLIGLFVSVTPGKRRVL